MIFNGIVSKPSLGAFIFKSEPSSSGVPKNNIPKAKNVCECYFFHKENVSYLSFSRRGQLVAHVDKEQKRFDNRVQDKLIRMNLHAITEV